MRSGLHSADSASAFQLKFSLASFPLLLPLFSTLSGALGLQIEPTGLWPTAPEATADTHIAIAATFPGEDA